MSMKHPFTRVIFERAIRVRAIFGRRGSSVPIEANEQGFTLLLAALVASVVLAIGSAIFGIALKQVTLSSIGRNSQYAFYAADSAAECALFSDIRSDLHPDTFATSSDSHNYAASITCNQQQISMTAVPGQITLGPGAATTTFFYAPGSYCVEVTVAKFLNPASNGINTTVRADGYSTYVGGAGDAQAQQAACTPPAVGGVPGVVEGDPQALQRSIELRY